MNTSCIGRVRTSFTPDLTIL